MSPKREFPVGHIRYPVKQKICAPCPWVAEKFWGSRIGLPSCGKGSRSIVEVPVQWNVLKPWSCFAWSTLFFKWWYLRNNTVRTWKAITQWKMIHIFANSCWKRSMTQKCAQVAAKMITWVSNVWTGGPSGHSILKASFLSLWAKEIFTKQSHRRPASPALISICIFPPSLLPSLPPPLPPSLSFLFFSFRFSCLFSSLSFSNLLLSFPSFLSSFLPSFLSSFLSIPPPS